MVPGHKEGQLSRVTDPNNGSTKTRALSHGISSSKLDQKKKTTSWAAILVNDIAAQH